MIEQHVIRVFEHDTLRVGGSYNGVKFGEGHFDSLTLFNEKKHGKLFSVVHRGIKFAQYVGVIRVGDLVIEILPKTDAALSQTSSDATKIQYRELLLEMLQRSRLSSFEKAGQTGLRLRNFTLLDLYILEFLAEVQTLLHRGLIKKYSVREENARAFTGQLQIPRNITLNLVHGERFYVRHQRYDYDHLLHQIIRKALLILCQTVTNGNLLDAVKRTLLAFPEVASVKTNEDVFNRIVFNRKTEPYKEAIGLAKLIILGYCPDLAAGNKHIVSFLFDMNLLWERYVYYELKRQEKASGYRVQYQQTKRFWGTQNIRPDIILTLGQQRFVLDAKWKVLKEFSPSSEDLRQMYAYNNYFQARESVLVYPDVYKLASHTGSFHKKIYFDGGTEPREHYCTIAFVSPLPGGVADVDQRRGVAKDLLGLLGKREFI